MSSKYEDIINLPHHVSTKYPQMPRRNRAAQFAPFAALTGYEEAVQEAARQTEPLRELEEEEKAAINRSLRYIMTHLQEQPVIKAIYFVKDARKSGGSYKSATGAVRAVDEYARHIILTSGQRIAIAALAALQVQA